MYYIIKKLYHSIGKYWGGAMFNICKYISNSWPAHMAKLRLILLGALILSLRLVIVILVIMIICNHTAYVFCDTAIPSGDSVNLLLNH